MARVVRWVAAATSHPCTAAALHLAEIYDTRKCILVVPVVLPASFSFLFFFFGCTATFFVGASPLFRFNAGLGQAERL